MGEGECITNPNGRKVEISETGDRCIPVGWCVRGMRALPGAYLKRLRALPLPCQVPDRFNWNS